MGVAAALGAACGLFAMDGIETPTIARALASLGPHPTVASLSESLAFGHPMVRRLGGVWDQSVPSLWIAAAARRRIDENPGDAALAARMRIYIDADRDRLVADLNRYRPDALLVGRLDTRFHQWLWNDPGSRRRAPIIASMRPRRTPVFPPNCGSAPTCSGCARGSPKGRVAPPDATAT